MHQQWESRQKARADFQRDILCEFCGGGVETYEAVYHPEKAMGAWVHKCQMERCDGEQRVDCDNYVMTRLTVDFDDLTYDFWLGCEQGHEWGADGGRIIPDDYDVLGALGCRIDRSEIEDQLKEMEEEGW